MDPVSLLQGRGVLCAFLSKLTEGCSFNYIFCSSGMAPNVPVLLSASGETFLMDPVSSSGSMPALPYNLTTDQTKAPIPEGGMNKSNALFPCNSQPKTKPQNHK